MGSRNRIIWTLVTVCLIFSLTACNLSGKEIIQTPTSTQQPATATETSQPTLTPTATATVTPTVTPTAGPTRTPVTSLDDGEGGQNVNYWQDTVTAFRELVRGQQVPDYYLDPEAPVTGKEFNPNQLLEPLTHLHIKPGYTLDFVYYYGVEEGHPILYVRRITDTPFADLEDFQENLDECDFQTSPSSCHYYLLVETDGSKEGYFEMILLQLMGEQFYLNLHAYYDDFEIIASQDRLEELISQISSNESTYPLPLTEEEMTAARAIDFTPVVIINQEFVTVRVVYFTMWGGFYEATITIFLTTPFKYKLIENKNILPYHCGYYL